MKQKTIQELLEFGILNIDKPQNPTSFDISDFVRRRMNEAGIKVRKTSHFGTLDPKVTGVLPIALNRACKLTGFFLGEDKEYVGIMRVHGEIEMKEIQQSINKKFLGKILQTPPVKSRVKRQERERDIKKFELLEQDGKDILFHTTVEGGTYIRKLIDDLGKEMGIGAHMLELRRIKAGIFSENDNEFVNLYDFEKALDEFEKGDGKSLRKILIPGEIISRLHYSIQVKEESIEKLLTGKPVLKKDLNEKSNAKKDKIVSGFCGERFIGMYKVLNEQEVFAKPKFVLQPMKN
ncbi:RNA-guided pseudouridylation complex pseudouridine synthase subunit Cbf5 [Candidatus Pacearchaeota archaeon CG10_big_fil_rev_8_21_14_0_10_34_12]|nr:MAG: RNA-guided pseudouridylation complex pseudouridine synthase subunit Cbf5 [Candidatus Pacearchaeota archaeon CG10_big_fil_rev_8_21_14_0_10_34_12]